MTLPKIQPDDFSEELVLTKDEQIPDQAQPDPTDRRHRNRRWASRTEAMIYGRIGSSKLNELMQAKLIVAKKNGVKVLVDLDSMDDYYDALPDVADAETADTAA